MNRLSFQTLLESIVSNVYYQSPGNMTLKYPCVLYTLKDLQNKKADNEVYTNRNVYTVTLMDKNPDSLFVNALTNIKYSSFDRHYVTSGINHFVFTINY